VPLPPPSPHSTCVVTGASSGIGLALARQLAAQGRGVTLVARREDRLRAVAEEIHAAHGVRAEHVAADVAEPEERRRVRDVLVERGLVVEVLVNNAGVGHAGRFQNLDGEVEARTVRVNCEAVVGLCGAFVPPMAERGRGAVLNVASLAGFGPVPRQTTYAATKAFVLSFSDALREDLHGRGVTVSALCPGPVDTDFFAAGGFEEAARRRPEFLFASAEDTARAGLRALEQGRRTEVPGAVNRIGAVGARHLPRSLLLPLLRRVNPLGV